MYIYHSPGLAEDAEVSGSGEWVPGNCGARG